MGDAVGVTVVLLTCGYKGQEFVRVGYYVNNSYTDPELQENPPDIPVFDKVSVEIIYSDVENHNRIRDHFELLIFNKCRLIMRTLLEKNVKILNKNWL